MGFRAYSFSLVLLITLMPLGHGWTHPLCIGPIYSAPPTPRNPKIELKETLAYVYDYAYELGFLKAPLTFSRVDQGSPSCLVFEFY